MNELIVTGVVESLSLDGVPAISIAFNQDGPEGDSHAGFTRKLSGHDGAYISTSDRKKGDRVFNVRSWTGLSKEEIGEVEEGLGAKIPQGTLLENFVLSGIPGFSKLRPTTRLVFQAPPIVKDPKRRPILVVWEENGPCKTVGQRLEDHHGREGMKEAFKGLAKGKRGLMGFVYAEGVVELGDLVLVYPPVE